MAKVVKIKIDFFALAKEFCGQWVALDPKTYAVLASAPTATEALSRAGRTGEDQPIVFRVIDNYGAVAPCLAPF